MSCWKTLGLGMRTDAWFGLGKEYRGKPIRGRPPHPPAQLHAARSFTNLKKTLAWSTYEVTQGSFY